MFTILVFTTKKSWRLEGKLDKMTEVSEQKQ